MAERRIRDDLVVIVLPMKKTVCVKFDQDLLKLIDDIIEKRRDEYSSRSDFLREAVLYYIQVINEAKNNNGREKNY